MSKDPILFVMSYELLPESDTESPVRLVAHGDSWKMLKGCGIFDKRKGHFYRYLDDHPDYLFSTVHDAVSTFYQWMQDNKSEWLTKPEYQGHLQVLKEYLQPAEDSLDKVLRAIEQQEIERKERAPWWEKLLDRILDILRITGP